MVTRCTGSFTAVDVFQYCFCPSSHMISLLPVTCSFNGLVPFSFPRSHYCVGSIPVVHAAYLVPQEEITCAGFILVVHAAYLVLLL